MATKLLVYSLLSLALFAAQPGACFSQQDSGEATLEERLKFGLQARRPVEIKFIQAVVATVNRGELPRKLVDRTYFWSRERSAKNGGRKHHRPIIYFKPALTLQAEKLGIEIRE